MERKQEEDFIKREVDGTQTRRKGYKEKAGKLAKRYNIWRYSTGRGNTSTDNYTHGHPAAYPEALARDHILSWSNPGDIVFDPMCGSGTTCKMAKQTGRHWLGFDMSEKYCELARKRVRYAQPPLFTEQTP